MVDEVTRTLRVSIRFPEEVHAALAKAAEQDFRTLQSEVLAIVVAELRRRELLPAGEPA